MTEIFDPSAFLSTVSGRPGVYRMFDSEARLLYVGKAKNLKNRLSSYFRKSGLAPKTADTGHLHVHQHHIGFQLTCLEQGFFPGLRLADHLQAVDVRQHSRNARTNEIMVIDY